MPISPVPPLDPRVNNLLGELPAEHFAETFYRSWELVDRYGSAWVVRLAEDLKLESCCQSPATAGEIVQRLGFVQRFDPPLRWLLQRLVAQGAATMLSSPGEPPRYQVALAPPESLNELRAACIELDPANASALDLLDAAASAYPAVARGKTTGQEALFGLGQIRLWMAYFSNANPTYAINNRVGAIAAARRVDGFAQARVVEIGGGTGSGTEALIEALEARELIPSLGAYRFTEPSPHFRRRTERDLRSRYAGIPWEVGPLDINLPFEDQGISKGSVHLLYAVNVLHLARDLDATLRQIRQSLAPGGWLVAAEAMRSFIELPLSTELIFQLLEGFHDVELHPTRRPYPGFLSPAQWEAFSRAAGFQRVEILPTEHERIRDFYPRFATGVVCAS